MPARPGRRAALRPPDEVSAGGLVHRSRDGRVEVVLIRVGAAWSLPKGNLDPGETAAEAALREVAEETGLPRAALRLGAPLTPSRYAYRRRDGRLVFKRVDHFLVELVAEAPLHPQEGEVDEAAWVGLDEAAGRVAYRDLRTALGEAHALLLPGRAG